MKRQPKSYRVFLGTVDKTTDNPNFGQVDVTATDALAAGTQVNLTLGKRQYVSAVARLVVEPQPPTPPYPQPEPQQAVA